MTPDNTKPNAVIFKLDNGKLAGLRIKDGKCDLDLVIHFKDDVTEKYPDLSAVNPFEWVFAHFDDKKLTTTSTKTTIPNGSFLKLYDAGVLYKFIEDDYKDLYGI